MRVSTAESMATNVVNGNFFHGFSGKHTDVKHSNESGSTCMYPVASMTPEAKALTMENKSLSGWRAGTERENSGRQTPIKLKTKMEAMAMSFNFSACALSWHAPFDLAPHCSDWSCTATAAALTAMLMRMMRTVRARSLEEAMASGAKAVMLLECDTGVVGGELIEM